MTRYATKRSFLQLYNYYNMPNDNTVIALQTRTEAEIIKGAESLFKSVPNLKLDFQREYGYALQALANNDTLAKYARNNPESLQMAIYNVAMTGLTLNPMLGYAYLVPRKVGGVEKVILDLGYKGMIFIVTSAGLVKKIWAEVVREKDVFHYEKGTNPYIQHVPELLPESERGAIVAAYAVAQTTSGETQFEVMHYADIKKIIGERKMSDGIWLNHTSEMCRKTPIRRLFKYIGKPDNLPENVQRAIEIHDENNPPERGAERVLIPVSDETDNEIQQWSDTISGWTTTDEFNAVWGELPTLNVRIKGAVWSAMKARAAELGFVFDAVRKEFYVPMSEETEETEGAE
jgi:phage RecT family recombinase